MNAKFEELFVGYGMEINGNNAYGLIKGYETNVIIRMFDNVSPVNIHISFYSTPEQKRRIEQDIRLSGIKFLRQNFTEYGIMIGLNDLTTGRLIVKFPDILDQIFSILSNNQVLDARFCPVCGNEISIESRKKVVINGYKISLDDSCIALQNQQISAENKDFSEAPNNYLRGFFGALLGGILGGVVAIVLSLIGFVSSLSAIVAVVAGVSFYKKFDGKPDKTMIVIVSGTTIVCMVGAVFALYVLAAYGAAIEANLSISALTAFSICMQDAEFSSAFYSDLALSLVFSAIGLGYEVYALSKTITRKQEIR